MADYVRHIATEGERWDHIALKYYGNPLTVGPIIMANPVIPITARIPAGTEVLIPVLEAADPAAAVASDLPPWRR